MKFLPKYQQKIVKISALTTQGRNPNNFLFVFWEKRLLYKYILKFTDLWTFGNFPFIKNTVTYVAVCGFRSFFLEEMRCKTNNWIFPLSKIFDRKLFIVAVPFTFYNFDARYANMYFFICLATKYRMSHRYWANFLT